MNLKKCSWIQKNYELEKCSRIQNMFTKNIHGLNLKGTMKMENERESRKTERKIVENGNFCMGRNRKRGITRKDVVGGRPIFAQRHVAARSELRAK